MRRVQRLVLLLQGVLLAALAENVTTVPSTESSSNATGHRPRLYRVDGADGAPCVLLEADVFVSVTWDISVNKTFATDAELGRSESAVRAEGGCGAEEATAALAWGAFRLHWTFAKTRGWEKWITKAVELRFDKWRVDHQSNQSEGETTLRPSAGSAGGVLLLSAPLGEAFGCDAPDAALELQLRDPAGASALVRLTHLRLQPFPAQPRFGRSHCPSHGAGTEWNASTETSDASGLNSSSSSSSSSTGSSGGDVGSPSTASGAEPSGAPTAAPSSAPPTNPGSGSTTAEPSADAASTPDGSSSSSGGRGHPSTEEDAQLSSTAPAAPALPSTPPPTPAAFLYGKKLPNGVSAPLYPPKKAFLSGVKVEDNEALSDMLWSWYKSGFYTGYYQALQRPKKIY